MLIGVMTLVLFMAGPAGGVAVQPVVVAREGNGKVTLRYDLPLGKASQAAQRIGETPATTDGSFVDWDQTAQINTSTGALEITGTNPNGNGSVRRNGNCTVGRLSWNGNQYAWRIPTSGGSVEYYNIDLTGYETCDEVRVGLIACAKGGDASAQISMNSTYCTTPDLPPTWQANLSPIWGPSIMNWNSRNNTAKVNIWNGGDTMGVNRIVVYITGADPRGEAPGPFNLISPTNGATGQPTSLTLDWGTSSGAEYYYVYFGTSNPPSYYSTVTASEIDMTDLSENTVYYWHIRAVNGYGSTLASNGPFSFTTEGGGEAPGPFNLISPTNGATGQPTSLTLDWGTSSGAEYYYVYFGTSNPPSYYSTVTASEIDMTDLSENTVYYWHIRAVNGYGSTLASNGPFSFRTGGSGGGEDTLHWDGDPYTAIGLTNGGRYLGAARFTRSSPCDVKSVLFYHNEASSSDNVYIYGPGTNVTPGSRLRARAYDGAQTGWLRIDLPASVPINSGDFWAIVGVTHEAGQYPLGVDAGPMVQDRGGFISQDDGSTWDQLNAFGLDYNWNIRAIITTGTGVEETLPGSPTVFEVAARPNPFSASTAMDFFIARTGPAKIEVCNASGRVVRTLIDGIVRGGSHRIVWDARDAGGEVVPNGIYLCRLEAGEFTATRKMVKSE